MSGHKEELDTIIFQKLYGLFLCKKARKGVPLTSLFFQDKNEYNFRPRQLSSLTPDMLAISRSFTKEESYSFL